MCIRMKMLCERDVKGLTVRLLNVSFSKMRGLFRRIQFFHLRSIKDPGTCTKVVQEAR